MMQACPCGGNDYARCCAPFHRALNAPDAQTLMRSRYSAYVLKLQDYVLATWHPATRPSSLDLAADSCKWLGLEIRQFAQQSHEAATVEFVARYKIAGRAYRLHELSRFMFMREDGRWYYVDGDFLE
jgi:SEC-C motif-containing protein